MTTQDRPARLSSEAKSDLTFSVPREYASVIEIALRRRGLPSLSAYGRLTILESLQRMGLVDEYFQVRKEEPLVHDQQDLHV